MLLPARRGEANQRTASAMSDGTTFTFFRQLERLFNGPQAARTEAEVVEAQAAPAIPAAPSKTLQWILMVSAVAGVVVFGDLLWED